MRVLLIIEQCNPDFAAVPHLGYKLYQSLSHLVEVTLCTHGRNEAALRARHPDADIVFLHESKLSTWYFKFWSPLLNRAGTNWPLFHLLLYPIYAEFNRAAYKHFSKDVTAGKYDIVHAFTPMIPRYPVKIVDACKNTSFFLGPVNGGVPFPKGFAEVAKKEYDFYNPLRKLCRFIPGYEKTYLKAEKVWVGSQYTLKNLTELFPQGNFELLSENAVEAKTLEIARPPANDRCRLLFVGRLEPFKCVDLLLQALALVKEKYPLTIVGDGSERGKLEKLTESLGLQDRVTFKGWVAPNDVTSLYFEADLFCFPSVRDFGGAVVLEAMAAGLPVIAVNYGGVAEYATDACAVLIEPESPETVIKGFAKTIAELASKPEVRQSMGEAARRRAEEYTWESKARRIVGEYKIIKD